jgi:trehalose-6-phosphate synthase
MLLGYLFLNFELVKTAGAWEAYDKYNLLYKEIIVKTVKNNDKIIPTNKIKAFV